MTKKNNILKACAPSESVISEHASIGALPKHVFKLLPQAALLSSSIAPSTMASSITLSLPRSLSLFPTTLSHSSDPHRHFILLHFHLHRIYPRIHASRRISNFPQEGLGIEEYEDGGDEEEEEEEEEEDRSLDLLVKFVENVFKKISRKARKAVRSVLPVTISTKLVGFSVNGVILLAFLWVLKAFLEVVCTIGSVVFVSILFIRGIWSGLSYLQQSRNYRANEFDDDNHAWTGGQPVS